MKQFRHNIFQIPFAILFFACILDSRAVISGASQALTICIQTVIPSLFPFMFFSGVLRSVWGDNHRSFLRIVGKICRLPPGAEKILFLGLLGGYPVGAKCVYDSLSENRISIEQANRMLGFCNNAGPSFIIGIVSILFDRMYIAWIIWGIQILSAVITGWLIPSRSTGYISNASSAKIDIVNALKQALLAIATVCGWLIIFRVVLQMLEKWILWLLPEYLKAVVAGSLELTNGILLLSNVPSPAIRFVLANLLLSIGGICIFLQTVSVAPGLDRRNYLLTKLLQTSICTLTSLCITPALFPGNAAFTISGLILSVLTGAFVLHNIKKRTGKRMEVAV